MRLLVTVIVHIRHMGPTMCECGKKKTVCVLHGGGSLCPCGRIKQLCRQHNGKALCVCGVMKHQCKLHGGDSYTRMRKRKLQRCEHGKSKICMICRPIQGMIERERNRLRQAFDIKRIRKTQSTVTYIGCTPAHLHVHIQCKIDTWNSTHTEQMKMTDISLDHIKPLKLGTTDEEMIVLLHYTNIQPLFKHHNSCKTDKWNVEDDAYWQLHIIHNPSYKDIYWPKACHPLVST